MTEQQRWNRYVDAINFCIECGYAIICEFTKNGNVKRLYAKDNNTNKECVLTLKPKKYKKMELLNLIRYNSSQSEFIEYTNNNL